MSQQQGWYPDSQVPGQVRYWDGQHWTPHVAPMMGPAYGGPPATPDGQLLASWWQRVGGSMIDSLILFPLGFVLALPFWLHVFDAWSTYFVDIGSGSASASALSIRGETRNDLLAIAGIGLALSFVYTVGFLSWKQATPASSRSVCGCGCATGRARSRWAPS